MRVSHLAAVATLVALLSAMFVALPSAGAAPIAYGDCAAAPMVNYLLIGDSCTIENTASTSESTSSDSSVASLPETEANNMAVTADGLGTATITVDDTVDDNDRTYTVTVIPASVLEITFDDSDDTVKAGTPLEVGVKIRAAGIASSVGSATVTLSVPSTGLFFAPDTGTTTSQQASLGAPTAAVTETVTAADDKASLSTRGAPDGTYIVTATLSHDIGNLKKGDYTKQLFIADPGKGVGSATLTLDTGEKSTVGVEDTVTVVVTAKNSLGNRANNSDVTQVIVRAIGADVTIEDSVLENDAPTDSTVSNGNQILDDDNDTTATTDDIHANAVTKATIARSTVGSVVVYALVIGSGVDARTDELTIVFSGPAESIAVGAASDQLGQMDKSITFDVTASDSAGNSAKVGPGAITVALKDADGSTPKNLTVTDMQKYTDKNDNDKMDSGEEDETVVVVTVTSNKTTAATPGEYTAEVTLNNDVDTKQTASFTVVGPAAEIAVEVDKSEVEIGDVVTVTATITDKDGNAISDRSGKAAGMTDVEFSSAGSLELAGFGADAGVVHKASNDGVATAKFVVTKGSGSAVILVDSGAATGTTSVSTAPVEVEAMPEPAPEMVGNHCIENKGGFAVWTCGVSAMASEVFALVQPEGATAIHLWSTISMSWVRYSVVDGTTVPGSSDFIVTENSILYISN